MAVTVLFGMSNFSLNPRILVEKLYLRSHLCSSNINISTVHLQLDDVMAWRGASTLDGLRRGTGWKTSRHLRIHSGDTWDFIETFQLD